MTQATLPSVLAALRASGRADGPGGETGLDALVRAVSFDGEERAALAALLPELIEHLRTADEWHALQLLVGQLRLKDRSLGEGLVARIDHHAVTGEAALWAACAATALGGTLRDETLEALEAVREAQPLQWFALMRRTQEPKAVEVALLGLATLPQISPDHALEIVRAYKRWAIDNDIAWNVALSRFQESLPPEAAAPISARIARMLGPSFAAQSASPGTATPGAPETRAQGGTSEDQLEPRPNILVVWGGAIGQGNLSCYSHGVAGYRTPNIDRLAREGLLFTDHYAEANIVAGQAAFLTGQIGFRTGLTGPIGSDQADVRKKIPTIATVLRSQGYATGHFGPSYLGDLNPLLPTAHGFDEFFGNLAHLHAEEAPEMDHYPKDPWFRDKFGPRGVIRSWATDTHDPTEQARWGAIGKQKIEDTGPLTTTRIETCDDEFVAAASSFIERAHAAKRPWFVWLNTTHMHFRTRVKPAYRGKAGPGQSDYHDAMVHHDDCVGTLLDLLDALGAADDTLVLYSTDTGAYPNTWPDAGTTPFQGEGEIAREGAFRVPALVRWPGRIAPGAIRNGIVSHLDWLPTLASIAGIDDVRSALLGGARYDGRSYKVHLDGFDLVDYLTGKTDESPRSDFIYLHGDAVIAVRWHNWKLALYEHGGATTPRNAIADRQSIKLFNLRTDPLERADSTPGYYSWLVDHLYICRFIQARISNFLETLVAFPPISAGSFHLHIERALEKLSKATPRR